MAGRIVQTAWSTSALTKKAEARDMQHLSMTEASARLPAIYFNVFERLTSNAEPMHKTWHDLDNQS